MKQFKKFLYACALALLIVASHGTARAQGDDPIMIPGFGDPESLVEGCEDYPTTWDVYLGYGGYQEYCLFGIYDSSGTLAYSGDGDPLNILGTDVYAWYYDPSYGVYYSFEEEQY